MSEYKFGYNHGCDDYDFLDSQIDPELVLKRARAAYPAFNPYAPPFTNLQYQGSQGACQGHALAHAFQVSCVQATGMQILFSRACGYYMAQYYDGIKGDRGSTLAGGQKVAENGICLENEWPYPSRYNNSMPSTADGNLNITMKGSRRITDADLAWDLLRSGSVIQTGIAWNSTCDKPVCDSYRSGGGGHSTILYGLDENTDNAIHHNSWKGWLGDSRNQWTKGFFSDILRKDRYAVFIAYDSTILELPENIETRI
jgi:hypothetical protein